MRHYRAWLAVVGLVVFGAAAEENPPNPPFSKGGFPFPSLHTEEQREFSTEPVYRFRGDPPPGQHDQRFPDDTGNYHFRPLSEREKAQRQSPSGWRPLDR
ncbi:hypothetical protein [Chromatium okenii]|uniref:hypothetical protein n=1 Tax=Chromatium okenii TaxID=61644 RepID=UPI000CF3D889|nr:hypothetical protein [Chromatium okenii]